MPLNFVVESLSVALAVVRFRDVTSTLVASRRSYIVCCDKEFMSAVFCAAVSPAPFAVVIAYVAVVPLRVTRIRIPALLYIRRSEISWGSEKAFVVVMI